MSIQLWLPMEEDLNYIPFRYVFNLSFISRKNYAGQKLNNLMWLRMAIEFISVFFLWLRLFG